jgi:ribose 5-phosphate isomerase B
MKIYVGADHNGYHMRRELIDYLKREGYDVLDDGDKHLHPDDDFPVFAQKVVTDVLSSTDRDPRGILLCGSGQGMVMAANRFNGIRAALGYDRESARSSRNDDDSNILCLPASNLRSTVVYDIVSTWLKTTYAGAPRFIRRLKELDQINGRM